MTGLFYLSNIAAWLKVAWEGRRAGFYPCREMLGLNTTLFVSSLFVYPCSLVSYWAAFFLPDVCFFSVVWYPLIRVAFLAHCNEISKLPQVLTFLGVKPQIIPTALLQHCC